MSRLRVFRVMMMLLGAHDDVQRKSLSRLQIVRRLAPWTSENPIFFHSMETSSDAMRQVVDQMDEVGFEMMIYSFGSGYTFETHNTTYLNRFKSDIAYMQIQEHRSRRIRFDLFGQRTWWIRW